jgi:uncharacterized protein
LKKYRIGIYKGREDSMNFQWDKEKSKANKEKHGISFEEAINLWENPVLMLPSKSSLEEQRFLVIGQISNAYWTAVITMREGEVRLISVRRSRKDERELYE